MKIIEKIKKVQGVIWWGIKLFGVSIVCITQAEPHCFDVYMFWIPLIRLKKTETTFGISILFFSWIYDFFKKFKGMETKTGKVIKFNEKVLFEKVDTTSIKALKFLNKNVYGIYTKEAFKFTTARFKG